MVEHFKDKFKCGSRSAVVGVEPQSAQSADGEGLEIGEADDEFVGGVELEHDIGGAAHGGHEGAEWLLGGGEQAGKIA